VKNKRVDNQMNINVMKSSRSDPGGGGPDHRSRCAGHPAPLSFRGTFRLGPHVRTIMNILIDRCVARPGSRFQPINCPRD